MSKGTNKYRILMSLFTQCIILLIGTFVCYKLTTTSYYLGHQLMNPDAESKNEINVTSFKITLTKDTSLNELSKQLKEYGLIKNTSLFKLEARLNKCSDSFIPGDYLINSHMSNSDILTLLTTSLNDKEETVKFTIPEGCTIEDIAKILDEKGIVTKEDFLDTITSKNFNSSYKFLSEIPKNKHYKYYLEGYLFPDTYTVRKGVSSEEIIIMMLNRFKEVINKHASLLNSSSYKLHEILSIASIIEKEAKLDEERPVISGVIYNRLKDQMYLQMCSTVQYALPRRKATLSLNDLQIDSFYNTYLYNGLPVGPICNPGEASIKAALAPTSHSYYYFVLENADIGKHYFSKTADEHNKAKEKYLQTNDINFT